MKRLIFALAATVAMAAAQVRVYEGSLTIPTYEHSGREVEPALFRNSTVAGMYPFTTYLMPFKDGGPKPRAYAAIFVENEYLKLTYIPEFGGRIFSLYDKLRGREVFYRNDVIKPAPYNPRNSWPQSGLELTGPHDLHMLTLYSEPYWSNRPVQNPDGSVTLALGETDPVYGMEVQLSATLHPGVAALEIGVRCYNGQTARMPQMLWINTAIDATPKTRFLYPMTRTVGHTTADIADWPLYNGIDYSWDRNNTHMLGVFGIDSYDDYQGAYQLDRDYGIFRYGDRRVVQGMKLWTFGYGDSGKRSVNTYTDNAGPYVELQSGRYVWDGHYEWVYPHKTESWSEWWVPVAGTGGLTTLSRDVALRLDIGATGTLALAATRVFKGATVRVRARSGEALNVRADLDPAKPFLANFALRGEAAEVVVEVRSADGRELLHYERPDSPPGRKDYTPFTRPLERLHQAAAERTVEELVLAGEFRLKELDDAGATALFEQALAKDSGYSRAHLQLGIQQYLHANYEQAVKHLDRAIERDPYSAESYYHLALSLLALGRDKEAERNLYYIWADSGFYGSREYQLGRLALIRGELDSAIRHFEGALDANSGDLNARVALALALDDKGNRDAALQQLTAAAQLQPSSRLALAARYAISGEAATELRRMLGGQTREAMTVALLFEDLRRWKDAVRLLKSVESDSRDPYGVPPEFYYTLAYCQRRAGDAVAADAALKQARAANGHIDRFPSRQESVAPLEEAAKLDPSDSQAHFLLACLLYHLDRPADAIVHWEAAIAANPRDFSSRRALGLALAERGETDQAAGQLQKAIELNPSHVRTLNDLSNLYARAGRFDAQLDLLKHALAKSPKDDDLAEGLLTAYLLKGEYAGAERLISEHVFSPRHRSYGLRDKYRIMRFAQGSIALNRGDAAAALTRYEETSRPPASLGMDDFAAQSTPRQQYYLGRAYDALGRKQDAQAAYARAVQGAEQLSGDRDSWSAENYFMVLALERSGRAEEAARLKKSFANFGQSETDDRSSHRRAAARYLLGLMARYEGRSGDANRLLRGAIEASPDLLAAQIELRGETPAPAGKDAHP